MNKRLRIVIDSGMVLLLPLLMAYSLVGEAAMNISALKYLYFSLPIISILRTQFVFVDFSQPVVWSLIDYLLVSILFIVLGYVCTFLFVQMSEGFLAKRS